MYSQYRGVTWSKAKKRWVVLIRSNRKKKHIGYFKDELAAANAYDETAKKYHKEFGILNFPQLAEFGKHASRITFEE